MKTSVSGFRAYLNISPVLLHNSLNCVETEAGPLSHSLGSKEWFKNVVLDLRGNPGAVIADLNHNAGNLAIGSNPQLAFAAHGVDGIVDDVGPHLVEFAPE